VIRLINRSNPDVRGNFLVMFKTSTCHPGLSLSMSSGDLFCTQPCQNSIQLSGSLLNLFDFDLPMPSDHPSVGPRRERMECMSSCGPARIAMVEFRTTMNEVEEDGCSHCKTEDM
jgi:hypothetical protein